jgi:tetratricopeptide repeat protein 30
LVFRESLKVSNLITKRYFENFNPQINTDTWYYAKRCFLALIETLSKHMAIMKDTSLSEILDFLDAAD